MTKDEIKALLQQARESASIAAVTAQDAAVTVADAVALAIGARDKVDAAITALDALNCDPGEDPGPEPVPTEALSVSFTGAGKTSEYHIWGVADPTGVLFWFHGDGAFEHDNPNSSYSFGGANGIRQVCQDAGLVLVSCLAPDTQGSVTWWEAGSANADYALALIGHLADKYGPAPMFFGGYSGGAQFVTRFLLPKHGNTLLPIGTLAVAGGGTPAITFTASDDLKVTEMAWVVGELDDGRGTTDGFNARQAAEQGLLPYIDVVGVDHYDWYPGATTDARWAEQRDGTRKLTWWANWCRQNGKKIGLPEWGLYTASSASGGDNARYIRGMVAWIRANLDIFEYEAYFNERASYITNDIHAGRNPNARAAYRAEIQTG